MPLTTELSGDEKKIIIKISGRFDFNIYQEFRQAYKQAKHADTQYVIDLGQTEYMDSSALGMLLLLRERAGGDQGDIKIVNTKPEIKKILTISNFQRLFKID